MEHLLETTGRFTSINQSFTCTFCKNFVPPLQKGCRNHCPFCLTSCHLDVFPGDRASNCGGKLKAIRYELSGKKGIVLIFQCQKCRVLRKNKAALEDKNQSDNYELILKL